MEVHCSLIPIAHELVCRQLKSLNKRLPMEMLLPDLHEEERSYVRGKFQRQGGPVQVLRGYKTVRHPFAERD